MTRVVLLKPYESGEKNEELLRPAGLLEVRPNTRSRHPVKETVGQKEENGINWDVLGDFWVYLFMKMGEKRKASNAQVRHERD